MTVQIPTSIHEVLERYRTLHQHLESHPQPTIPQEALREAELLADWLDVESMAHRVHMLTCVLEEHLAGLDGMSDTTFSLVLAAREQTAQLSDAISAVEVLHRLLKRHKEAAAQSKPDTETPAQMNPNELATAGPEVE
ncbi:MAG TPA: hypothetical protein ENJ98_02645 [Thiolapillus brandeum]|uniref:Uncharacterized protein n=1 Tax=Thiolapillus brandeum TaxID=1076588 RepID=A0A7C5IYN6_9GAMM|nr:hypothetical protein [Thiolapillus brandeum]